MPVTLRLAFRNIFEHRSKSLIIGILLALGSLILVTGNSFIDASKEGIRSTFTDNYTGDVFVSGQSSEGPVSLFGVTSVGGLAPTPIIPEFETVIDLVRNSPLVEKSSGMATNYAIVMRGTEVSMEEQMQSAAESDDPSSRFLFLFGIDTENYWSMFESMDITSGARISQGQTGLIINEVQLEKLSAWMGRPLGVGDLLTIQGFSSAGMKIRELPILGTYHQRGEGAAPEQMCFVDIDTLRILAGMTVGTNEDVVLTEAQTGMLGDIDTDSLFSDDLFEDAPVQGAQFDEVKLQSEFADTKARELANTADEGAWQFIVVRTKKPSDAPALIKELNLAFAEKGISATAGDWQMAAGPYGQSVDVIRIVFTIAIVILSIVAIIIIMNTFVISVIERTGEIGTMRAIGAEKRFIRRLFAAEATVLATVFSLVGSLLALGVVALLKGLKIEAGNPFLEVLFGGKYLSPFVTPMNFILAIAAMILVGYVAHLYPVHVALKIRPVQAMQNE